MYQIMTLKLCSSYWENILFHVHSLSPRVLDDRAYDKHRSERELWKNTQANVIHLYTCMTTYLQGKVKSLKWDVPLHPTLSHFMFQYNVTACIFVFYVSVLFLMPPRKCFFFLNIFLCFGNYSHQLRDLVSKQRKPFQISLRKMKSYSLRIPGCLMK